MDSLACACSALSRSANLDAHCVTSRWLRLAKKHDTFRKVLLICLCGVICCGIASAQRRDRTIFQFQHTAWTAKEGAPGPIYALAQTSDGFLWIGTSSGLYRFDGVQFELYRPPSGQHFDSDSIHSLLATLDGGLWIGFTYGGADFLKDGRVTRYDQPEGLLGDGSVDQFAMGPDGAVWVVSIGGLGRFDGSHWQFITPDWGYPGDQTRTLFADREGTLWVASKDALYFLLRGKRKFQKCADHLGTVTSIGQTHDGALWLSQSLAPHSEREWTVRTVRPTPVLPAAEVKPLPRIMEIDAVNGSLVDHAGSLWIGTMEGLLRVPDPERMESNGPVPLDEHTAERFQQKDGLTTGYEPPRAMMEDSQGDIWIGTETGLDRFRESNVVPVPIKTSTSRLPLVAGDHGDVWTFAWNFPQGSLVDMHGLTATSQPTQAVPTAAYRDNKGVIWLGGPKGLWRFENGRLTHYPLPQKVTNDRLLDVQAITGDPAGGLFLSIVGNRVYHWANGVWSGWGNPHDITDEAPVSLLTDSGGRIWFGYTDPGNMAVLDRGHVNIFSSKDGPQVEFIQALCEREGRLWIGGEKGLALFRDNHFQSFTPDGDAAFKGISGIVETANGDLWVNAAPGIFHIAAAEIERAIKVPSYHVRYDLFGVLDGLNGNAVQLRPLPTEVESSDGLLWFLTNAGIFQINPNHLLRNAIAPSVQIRSLDSGGVVHSGAAALKLPARSTDVHIEYTAPNLSLPERVHYRYMLEGSDKGWQDVGTRREAFYTNLGPRHYRFRVIACNEDGVWNTVGAAMEFTIAPAWFQTYWFFALCAAAALLVLWVLYRIRVRQVANAMAVRFDDRLNERTRIARDFHDTLLQTIQGSKLVADSALKQSTDSTPMRAAVEQLSIWLGRATEEGRAALNSLRSSASETNDLAEAFQRAIDECRIHGFMEASFSVVGQVSEMHPIVRDEVYRIGYEAIRNACVHSQATQLQVELTYAEDLVLVVRDNGVGIDPGVIGKGKEGHFGLEGMRERARRIMSKLAVETSSATGTEIKLAVPGSIIYRRTLQGKRKSPTIKSLLKRIGLTSDSPDA